MSELKFLQERREWARGWLAKPESELPGALTHEKCYRVLEEVEDKLIDFIGIKPDDKGNWVYCFRDPSINSD